MRKRSHDSKSKWWVPPKTRDQRRIENREIVELMASEGATQQDIADYLDLSRSSIAMTYIKEYNAGRRRLEMSLRQWQIDKARDGDTDMLKHLGRVYVKDQKDLNTETLTKNDLKEGIDMICGNSVQNKSTTSKIQTTDTISPSDQSVQENQ
jgi:predicted transcriptional regulator